MRQDFKVVITLTFTLFCIAPNLAQTSIQQKVEKLAVELLEESGIPGMAISIVKNDSVILSEGYGVRSINSDDLVTSKTVFGVGSLTKAMTATAMAMLVDSGLVDWEDPIKKHIPHFRLSDPYVTKNLEIQDVLSLREGISNGDTIAKMGMTPDEIITRMTVLTPTNFRKSFGQSPNIMYFLAGQVVGSVTNSSWEDFVNNRIFEPLQMTYTSSKLAETKRLKNIATPHLKLNKEVRPTQWHGLEHLASAAGVNSNVNDLANWMNFHLRNGRFGGSSLVSENALSETYRAHSILSDNYQSFFNEEAPFNAYGYGWVISQYRNKTLLEHGGAVDGFGAVIALVPEENLGIVILSNLNFGAAISYLKGLKFNILNIWLAE
jgi:CubicO group peptidase (beta-lactamase class C family)